MEVQEHAFANTRNFRTLLTAYYIAIRLKHESARSLVKAIAEMNKEIILSPDLTKRDYISQVKTLFVNGMLNKDLVDPIL